MTYPAGTPEDKPEPLKGMRVLDLSRFIAGPLCGQLLGDMGAEVIKLERPGGEDARQLGPFVDGMSLYVMSYNRNKLGMTLDTRSPQALGILEELVAHSDVLVENYRPGTLEKMGIGHERLRQINPRLVVTSLSGFGQTGPMAGRALFDAIAQAMSGLMTLTGEPEDPPTMAGAFIADYLTGVFGALGTTTALLHRERTGTGQVVDVGSLDVLFSSLGTAPSAYANLGRQSRRTGSRDELSGPANLFQTSDGWVYMHAGTNPLFRRLCGLIGAPELAEGEWGTIAGRMADIEAVEDCVQQWLSSLTTDQVAELLEEAAIPFGPALTVPEVVELPQLAARQMLVPVPHTGIGEVTLTGMPVKLSESPGVIRRGAPQVGEHNSYVYQELLSRSDEEFVALRQAGVV
ncbi:CaiB/BaiF CoA transferase family protein [Nesterenkonia ebinurensis]|uniref:CaiB/BaiF CoA transferase family protein n=1 Tax=Nesterenkonia ebinurensis TaxID=2608252 RepID=UPI00123CC476|nr:CoA transferase [Nesterenkonia ebinurensis]